MAGEGEEDVRGREGTGRKDRKGRRRRREGEGNLVPTVISESRRLWSDVAGIQCVMDVIGRRRL